MKFLKIIKPITIFFGTLSLMGCGAILPGMSLQNSPAYNTPPPNPITPLIIPITPALIKQVSPDLSPYSYHIGAGDTLNIATWSKTGVSVSLTGNDTDTITPAPLTNTTSTITLVNPALKSSGNAASTPTGGYFVNSDGDVFIPILGNVHVANLTEDQTDKLLAQKLSVYIRAPQVRTTVSSFASQQVFILGEINGGNTNTTGGMTTSSMMALPITGTPMTLATAMSQAGGMNLSTANTRLIYVIRESSLTHPSVYWLSMESPASMLYAENFPLINNDIVYVSTAGIANFNRVLNQILPGIQTIWFTDSVIRGSN